MNICFLPWWVGGCLKDEEEGSKERPKKVGGDWSFRSVAGDDTFHMFNFRSHL